MKAKHSPIIQKREEEVRRRLSATGNGKQHGPMLDPGTICYEVSDKIRGISCGGLGLLQQLVKTVGLGEATLRHYEYYLAPLLRSLGNDPSSFTAQKLRDFVQERSMQCGGGTKKIFTSVRMFLRYLVTERKCPADNL